ncbi:MAG: hypothetical protein WAV32_09770 [Halobacteriota archaeon]
MFTAIEEWGKNLDEKITALEAIKNKSVDKEKYERELNRFKKQLERFKEMLERFGELLRHR